MKTYVIKRTGRRNRPELVTLASGESLKLNATGTHVRELSEADVALVSSIPGTLVIESKAKVAPEPKHEPKPEPPEPKKAKKARKPKSTKK